MRDGDLDGLETLLDMADYPVLEYDVLVVGAGGAGLRAAIEASSGGAKTGVVTKSLLGKGPHCNGRGRHGGGDGQRGRSR